MDHFKRSVVWITGGGSGIGRALALRFAHEGADVVVSGRRVSKLDEVVSTIEAQGGRALAVPCDVCDVAAVRAAVRSVVERFGRLDVAVANAGVGVPRMPRSRYERIASVRRVYGVTVPARDRRVISGIACMTSGMAVLMLMRPGVARLA